MATSEKGWLTIRRFILDSDCSCLTASTQAAHRPRPQEGFANVQMGLTLVMPGWLAGSLDFLHPREFECHQLHSLLFSPTSSLTRPFATIFLPNPSPALRKQGGNIGHDRGPILLRLRTCARTICLLCGVLFLFLWRFTPCPQIRYKMTQYVSDNW